MRRRSKSSKNKNIDVISHGHVMLSDGQGRARPARLELNSDALTIQILLDGGIDEETLSIFTSTHDLTHGTRHVTVKRSAKEGLGLSLKGGADVAPGMPVLISNMNNVQLVHERSSAPQQQLYVGDAIAEVNGVTIDGKSHEEVVTMLKEGGDQVRLTVRHYTQLAPYVRRSESWRQGRSKSRSGSIQPSRKSRPGSHEPNYVKSVLKSAHHEGDNISMSMASTIDSTDANYRTIAKIPLPMAYLTIYLEGTDKQRSNAFELKAVDGTSSGVIHCEDSTALDHWLKLIRQHIHTLNNKSIKLSNKYLHPSETIIYLGWIAERTAEGIDGDLAHKWQPRFLILKGNDACLYDSPPLDSESLAECVSSYKIYETLCRQVKPAELADRRQHCLQIETATPSKHYISAEDEVQLIEVQGAWHRATFYAVQRLQSRTFAVNFAGRPSGLTLDVRHGIMLYDIPLKRYVWQYPLSYLRTSSDDGGMRLQLVLRSNEQDVTKHALRARTPSPMTRGRSRGRSTSVRRGEDGVVYEVDEEEKEEMTDTRDIDCAELYPLIYTMHAVYLARIIGVDPEFLQNLK